MNNTHKLRTILTVAMVATVVMWVIAFSFPRDFSVGHFVDDARYAVLAKSIRETASYRAINLPGQPPETKYPPGWPATLAFAWSPDQSDASNLSRLRWVNFAIVGVLAGVLTLFGASALQLSAPVAAVAALVGLLSPGTAELWMVPLSAPLFLVLVTGGLLTLTSGYRLFGIAVLVVAVYVRTVAAAFLLAALIVGWRRRDRVWYRQLALMIVGVLPWLVWQVAHRASVPEHFRGLYGSYGRWYLDSFLVDPLTLLVRVPWRNGIDGLHALGRNAAGLAWGAWPLVILVGGIIAWRIYAARKVSPVAVFGLAMYGTVALMWPFPPGRFIAGAWPLVFLIALSSVPRRMAVGICAVVATFVMVTIVRGDAVRAHRSRGATADQAIELAGQYVSSGQVWATTNSSLHYLRLGVETVPSQRMRSYRRYRLGDWVTAWGLADDLWPIIERHGVSYVLVEPRGVEGRYAAASLISQCGGVLTPVLETTRGALLFGADHSAMCDPESTVR